MWEISPSAHPPSPTTLGTRPAVRAEVGAGAGGVSFALAVLETPRELASSGVACGPLDASRPNISKADREIAIDDSRVPYVLVLRDIEEKRAAEREKEQITEWLSRVLGATTDGIIAVNRNWAMTYL
jgi:PAS domain-containing protein